MFLFYFFCTEQRLCSCVDCDFTKKVKWPSNCIRMTWDQDGVAYVCVLFSGEVISSFDYFAVCSTIIFAIDFANFKIRILTACVFLCLSFCIIHSLFCFTPSYSLKIIICHENMYYFMLSILIAYCTPRDSVVILNMFYFYVSLIRSILILCRQFILMRFLW